MDRWISATFTKLKLLVGYRLNRSCLRDLKGPISCLTDVQRARMCSIEISWDRLSPYVYHRLVCPRQTCLLFWMWTLSFRRAHCMTSTCSQTALSLDVFSRPSYLLQTKAVREGLQSDLSEKEEWEDSSSFTMAGLGSKHGLVNKYCRVKESTRRIPWWLHPPSFWCSIQTLLMVFYCTDAWAVPEFKHNNAVI